MVTISSNEHTVPEKPVLISANRLSGTTATVNWIPLTHIEAKGLLTSLQIVYGPLMDTQCSSYNFTNSNVVLVLEDLYEQRTANITSLEANREYCVAIQVSTSGGESGLSNTAKLSCKTTTISQWPGRYS